MIVIVALLPVTKAALFTGSAMIKDVDEEVDDKICETLQVLVPKNTARTATSYGCFKR